MNGVGSKVVALTALLLLVGCGFMVAGAIAAQVDLPLTLSEAITAALQDNPEIQAARNEIESAASQITQARSGLLPQVYVSETYAYTNSPLWGLRHQTQPGGHCRRRFYPRPAERPGCHRQLRHRPVTLLESFRRGADLDRLAAVQTEPDGHRFGAAAQ